MERQPLGRPTVGTKALFAIVGSIVGASAYFSLGVITDRALEWTPIVFIIAGFFFVLAAMTFAEGTSLHRERGGSTVLARYAFNELVSFIAGWAILIDYLILIAICALSATKYAATFWAPLGSGGAEVVCAVAIIFYVAISNILGNPMRRLPRAAVLVSVDYLLQFVVIVLGLLMIVDPNSLTDPLLGGDVPTFKNTIYALVIATIAFPGLEAAAGLASEVDPKADRPWFGRLVKLGTASVFVTYVALSLIAVSALDVGEKGTQFTGEAIATPMLAIVHSYDPNWLGNALGYIVAAVATMMLILAANSAMLGLSRLSYSLATNRQIPNSLGWLHRTKATPYVLITIAAGIAAALVIPTDLGLLVGLYAFGSTLALSIAHLSVCVLRFKEPDLERPYKIPFSIKVGRGSVPIPAAIGTVASVAAWISVLALHEGARTFGLAWLVGGLVLYVGYRKLDGASLLKRVTVPESVLREEPREINYGSILVPLFGNPLDDDIVQTAGRLASEEASDDGTASTIEALWIFEVPISLPMDASLPDTKLKEARKALSRAKAIGEEYGGVEVATATVRARKTGKAIVEEAERRGVEAIVLAAEEPSKIGGSALLGGLAPIENFVGDVTKYVVNKARCRVILTAPRSSTHTETESDAKV